MKLYLSTKYLKVKNINPKIDIKGAVTENKKTIVNTTTTKER
jgi:hypothetical protein